MAEIKDVIKHFNDCIDYANESGDSLVFTLVSKLKDAIQFLSEELPRVLTLDEAYTADFVWYESRSVYNSNFGTVRIGDTRQSVRIRRLCGSYAYEDKRDYGSTWRCWNKKPSDEEMKAVKWNG